MLPDLLSCYQICCGVTADIFRNLLFTKFVIFFGFAVMLPSLLLCFWTLLPCCWICCHVSEFAVRSPDFAVMFTSLLLDLGSIFSWCFPKFCVAFCKFASLFPNLLSSFRICCAVSEFAFLLPNLLHFFLNLLHSFPFMLPNLLWCFRMCCTIWCTFSRSDALFLDLLHCFRIHSHTVGFTLVFANMSFVLGLFISTNLHLHQIFFPRISSRRIISPQSLSHKPFLTPSVFDIFSVSVWTSYVALLFLMLLSTVSVVKARVNASIWSSCVLSWGWAQIAGSNVQGL